MFQRGAASRCVSAPVLVYTPDISTAGSPLGVRGRSTLPRVPSRPSASVSSDSCTRSSSGSTPSIASVHAGSLDDDRQLAAPAARDLVLEHGRERIRAAAEPRHARGHAAGLDADRDRRRALRSPTSSCESLPGQAAERPELVAGDQHLARARSPRRHSSAHDPPGRVGLVGEADLDVLGVAGHAWIGETGLRRRRRARSRPPPAARRSRPRRAGPPRRRAARRSAPSAGRPTRARGSGRSCGGSAARRRSAPRARAPPAARRSARAARDSAASSSAVAVRR